MPARRRARARLLLLGSAVSFGLMAVLARLLSRGPGGFSAGQLTVVRFVVGAAVSLAAFRLRPGLYRPRNRKLLWGRGLSGGIVVVLYFLALQRIPAGEAGMLYNLFPVIATGMSLVAFRERPTIHLGLALALATVGVVLVLGQGSLRLGLGAGEALALGAAPPEPQSESWTHVLVPLQPCENEITHAAIERSGAKRMAHPIAGTKIQPRRSS